MQNTFVLDASIREQMRERSNGRGALAVLQDWGLLVLAFGLSMVWPHPLMFFVSTLLLCAVHVGFAILTHESAHRSLFANAKLNDFIGQYFCASPNFNNMPMYRSYHMAHHRNAGTKDDPDLVMVERYPISKASLRRKLIRDVSGQSGIKFLIGLVGMVSGYWKFQQNGLVERIAYDQPQGFLGHARIFARNGGLVSIVWQIALLSVLLAFGHGLYYLFWVAAFVIPFPLLMRVRVLADHAMVSNPLSTNALEHARSTRANWIEKLLIAPHNEHYHLEHHLVPSAPFWNLPKLHAILEREGAIPPENKATGMLDVLRRVSV